MIGTNPKDVCTTTFGAPPGHEGTVGGLPVRAEPDDEFGALLHSYWQPSEAELDALRDGGHVRLTICGTGHPPVALAVTSPADPLVLDGVGSDDGHH